jgi:hypothetical protein
MRFSFLAVTASLAALPAVALAQAINPVGMTLPSFQSASLMTVSSQDYSPLKAYDPSAMATRPMPAPKMHAADAITADAHTAPK